MTGHPCIWLQVSVLLRYLASKGGAAGWHLTAQQASALEQELQPQVHAHCAAHIHWCSAEQQYQYQQMSTLSCDLLHPAVTLYTELVQA